MFLNSSLIDILNRSKHFINNFLRNRKVSDSFAAQDHYQEDGQYLVVRADLGDVSEIARNNKKFYIMISATIKKDVVVDYNNKKDIDIEIPSQSLMEYTYNAEHFTKNWSWTHDNKEFYAFTAAASEPDYYVTSNNTYLFNWFTEEFKRGIFVDAHSISDFSFDTIKIITAKKVTFLQKPDTYHNYSFPLMRTFNDNLVISRNNVNYYMIYSETRMPNDMLFHTLVPVDTIPSSSNFSKYSPIKNQASPYFLLSRSYDWYKIYNIFCQPSQALTSNPSDSNFILNNLLHLSINNSFVTGISGYVRRESDWWFISTFNSGIYFTQANRYLYGNFHKTHFGVNDSVDYNQLYDKYMSIMYDKDLLFYAFESENNVNTFNNKQFRSYTYLYNIQNISVYDNNYNSIRFLRKYLIGYPFSVDKDFLFLPKIRRHCGDPIKALDYLGHFNVHMIALHSETNVNVNSVYGHLVYSNNPNYTQYPGHNHAFLTALHTDIPFPNAMNPPRMKEYIKYNTTKIKDKDKMYGEKTTFEHEPIYVFNNRMKGEVYYFPSTFSRSAIIPQLFTPYRRFIISDFFTYPRLKPNDAFIDAYNKTNDFVHTIDNIITNYNVATKIVQAYASTAQSNANLDYEKVFFHPLSNTLGSLPSSGEHSYFSNIKWHSANNLSNRKNWVRFTGYHDYWFFMVPPPPPYVTMNNNFDYRWKQDDVILTKCLTPFNTYYWISRNTNAIGMVNVTRYADQYLYLVDNYINDFSHIEINNKILKFIKRPKQEGVYSYFVNSASPVIRNDFVSLMITGYDPIGNRNPRLFLPIQPLSPPNITHLTYDHLYDGYKYIFLRDRNVKGQGRKALYDSDNNAHKATLFSILFDVSNSEHIYGNFEIINMNNKITSIFKEAVFPILNGTNIFNLTTVDYVSHYYTYDKFGGGLMNFINMTGNKSILEDPSNINTNDNIHYPFLSGANITSVGYNIRDFYPAITKDMDFPLIDFVHALFTPPYEMNLNRYSLVSKEFFYLESLPVLFQYFVRYADGSIYPNFTNPSFTFNSVLMSYLTTFTGINMNNYTTFTMCHQELYNYFTRGFSFLSILNTQNRDFSYTVLEKIRTYPGDVYLSNHYRIAYENWRTHRNHQYFAYYAPRINPRAPMFYYSPTFVRPNPEYKPIDLIEYTLKKYRVKKSRYKYVNPENVVEIFEIDPYLSLANHKGYNDGIIKSDRIKSIFRKLVGYVVYEIKGRKLFANIHIRTFSNTLEPYIPMYKQDKTRKHFVRIIKDYFANFRKTEQVFNFKGIFNPPNEIDFYKLKHKYYRDKTNTFQNYFKLDVNLNLFHLMSNHDSMFTSPFLEHMESEDFLHPVEEGIKMGACVFDKNSVNIKMIDNNNSEIMDFVYIPEYTRQSLISILEEFNLSEDIKNAILNDANGPIIKILIDYVNGEEYVTDQLIDRIFQAVNMNKEDIVRVLNKYAFLDNNFNNNISKEPMNILYGNIPNDNYRNLIIKVFRKYNKTLSYYFSYSIYGDNTTNEYRRALQKSIMRDKYVLSIKYKPREKRFEKTWGWGEGFYVKYSNNVSIRELKDFVGRVENLVYRIEMQRTFKPTIINGSVRNSILSYNRCLSEEKNETFQSKGNSNARFRYLYEPRGQYGVYSDRRRLLNMNYNPDNLTRINRPVFVFNKPSGITSRYLVLDERRGNFVENDVITSNMITSNNYAQLSNVDKVNNLRILDDTKNNDYNVLLRSPDRTREPIVLVNNLEDPKNFVMLFTNNKTKNNQMKIHNPYAGLYSMNKTMLLAGTGYNFNQISIFHDLGKIRSWRHNNHLIQRNYYDYLNKLMLQDKYRNNIVVDFKGDIMPSNTITPFLAFTVYPIDFYNEAYANNNYISRITGRYRPPNIYGAFTKVMMPTISMSINQRFYTDEYRGFEVKKINSVKYEPKASSQDINISLRDYYVNYLSNLFVYDSSFVLHYAYSNDSLGSGHDELLEPFYESPIKMTGESTSYRNINNPIYINSIIGTFIKNSNYLDFLKRDGNPEQTYRAKITKREYINDYDITSVSSNGERVMSRIPFPTKYQWYYKDHLYYPIVAYTLNDDNFRYSYATEDALVNIGFLPYSNNLYNTYSAHSLIYHNNFNKMNRLSRHYDYNQNSFVISNAGQVEPYDVYVFCLYSNYIPQMPVFENKQLQEEQINEYFYSSIRGASAENEANLNIIYVNNYHLNGPYKDQIPFGASAIVPEYLITNYYNDSLLTVLSDLANNFTNQENMIIKGNKDIIVNHVWAHMFAHVFPTDIIKLQNINNITENNSINTTFIRKGFIKNFYVDQVNANTYTGQAVADYSYHVFATYNKIYQGYNKFHVFAPPTNSINYVFMPFRSMLRNFLYAIYNTCILTNSNVTTQEFRSMALCMSHMHTYKTVIRNIYDMHINALTQNFPDMMNNNINYDTISDTVMNDIEPIPPVDYDTQNNLFYNFLQSKLNIASEIDKKIALGSVLTYSDEDIVKIKKSFLSQYRNISDEQESTYNLAFMKYTNEQSFYEALQSVTYDNILDLTEGQINYFKILIDNHIGFITDPYFAFMFKYVPNKNVGQSNIPILRNTMKSILEYFFGFDIMNKLSKEFATYGTMNSYSGSVYLINAINILHGINLYGAKNTFYNLLGVVFDSVTYFKGNEENYSNIQDKYIDGYYFLFSTMLTSRVLLQPFSGSKMEIDILRTNDSVDNHVSNLILKSLFYFGSPFYGKSILLNMSDVYFIYNDTEQLAETYAFWEEDVEYVELPMGYESRVSAGIIPLGSNSTFGYYVGSSGNIIGRNASSKWDKFYGEYILPPYVKSDTTNLPNQSPYTLTNSSKDIFLGNSYALLSFTSLDGLPAIRTGYYDSNKQYNDINIRSNTILNTQLLEKYNNIYTSNFRNTQTFDRNVTELYSYILRVPDYFNKFNSIKEYIDINVSTFDDFGNATFRSRIRNIINNQNFKKTPFVYNISSYLDEEGNKSSYSIYEKEIGNFSHDSFTTNYLSETNYFVMYYYKTNREVLNKIFSLYGTYPEKIYFYQFNTIKETIAYRSLYGFSNTTNALSGNYSYFLQLEPGASNILSIAVPSLLFAYFEYGNNNFYENSLVRAEKIRKSLYNVVSHVVLQYHLPEMPSYGYDIIDYGNDHSSFCKTVSEDFQLDNNKTYMSHILDIMKNHYILGYADIDNMSNINYGYNLIDTYTANVVDAPNIKYYNEPDIPAEIYVSDFSFLPYVKFTNYKKSGTNNINLMVYDKNTNVVPIPMLFFMNKSFMNNFYYNVKNTAHKSFIFYNIDSNVYRNVPATSVESGANNINTSNSYAYNSIYKLCLSTKIFFYNTTYNRRDDPSTYIFNQNIVTIETVHLGPPLINDVKFHPAIYVQNTNRICDTTEDKFTAKELDLLDRPTLYDFNIIDNFSSYYNWGIKQQVFNLVDGYMTHIHDPITDNLFVYKLGIINTIPVVLVKKFHVLNLLHFAYITPNIMCIDDLNADGIMRGRKVIHFSNTYKKRIVYDPNNINSSHFGEHTYTSSRYNEIKHGINSTNSPALPVTLFGLTIHKTTPFIPSINIPNYNVGDLDLIDSTLRHRIGVINGADAYHFFISSMLDAEIFLRSFHFSSNIHIEQGYKNGLPVVLDYNSTMMQPISYSIYGIGYGPRIILEKNRNIVKRLYTILRPNVYAYKTFINYVIYRNPDYKMYRMIYSREQNRTRSLNRHYPNNLYRYLFAVRNSLEINNIDLSPFVDSNSGINESMLTSIGALGSILCNHFFSYIPNNLIVRGSWNDRCGYNYSLSVMPLMYQTITARQPNNSVDVNIWRWDNVTRYEHFEHQNCIPEGAIQSIRINPSLLGSNHPGFGIVNFYYFMYPITNLTRMYSIINGSDYAKTAAGVAFQHTGKILNHGGFPYYELQIWDYIYSNCFAHNVVRYNQENRLNNYIEKYVFPLPHPNYIITGDDYYRIQDNVFFPELVYSAPPLWQISEISVTYRQNAVIPLSVGRRKKIIRPAQSNLKFDMNYSPNTVSVVNVSETQSIITNIAINIDINTNNNLSTQSSSNVSLDSIEINCTQSQTGTPNNNEGTGTGAGTYQPSDNITASDNITGHKNYLSYEQMFLNTCFPQCSFPANVDPEDTWDYHESWLYLTGNGGMYAMFMPIENIYDSTLDQIQEYTDPVATETPSPPTFYTDVRPDLNETIQ